MTTSLHDEPQPAPAPAPRFSMELGKFVEMMTGRALEPYQIEMLRFVEAARDLQVHGGYDDLNKTFDEVKQRLPYLFATRGSWRQDALASVALANRRMEREYGRVCALPYIRECLEQQRLRHFHARSGIDRPRFSSFAFRGAGFRVVEPDYSHVTLRADFSSHISPSMLRKPEAAFTLNG